VNWGEIARPWAFPLLVIGVVVFLVSSYFVFKILQSEYIKVGFLEFLRSLSLRRFIVLGFGAFCVYVVFTTSVNMIFGALVVILHLNIIWFIVIPRLSYLVICAVFWLLIEGKSSERAGEE